MPSDESQTNPSTTEFLIAQVAIYLTSDGQSRIEVQSQPGLPSLVRLLDIRKMQEGDRFLDLLVNYLRKNYESTR